MGGDAAATAVEYLRVVVLTSPEDRGSTVPAAASVRAAVTAALQAAYGPLGHGVPVEVVPHAKSLVLRVPVARRVEAWAALSAITELDGRRALLSVQASAPSLEELFT